MLQRMKLQGEAKQRALPEEANAWAWTKKAISSSTSNKRYLDIYRGHS
jgi:hypothetical protein